MDLRRVVLHPGHWPWSYGDVVLVEEPAFRKAQRELARVPLAQSAAVAGTE